MGIVEKKIIIGATTEGVIANEAKQ